MLCIYDYYKVIAVVQTIVCKLICCCPMHYVTHYLFNFFATLIRALIANWKVIFRCRI